MNINLCITEKGVCRISRYSAGRKGVQLNRKRIWKFEWKSSWKKAEDKSLSDKYCN